MSSFNFLEITIIPMTKIIGPELASKEAIQRWIKRGWIREEFKEEYKHIDKVFPRDYKGRPYITKEQLCAPIRRVCRDNGLDSKQILDFDIVDKNDLTEINYMVIPEYPLVQSRAILNIERNVPESLETFEYIDSTFRSTMLIRTRVDPKKVAAVIAEAGKKYGLFGKTKKGYGKFAIEAREVSCKQ